MSLPKPKLERIKTVLADAVVRGERAGVGPLEIVGEITETTPSNSLPIKQPEDSAQLVCFSWRLMRLSVGHLGAQNPAALS
jgi:hypothetical protein